MQMLPWKHRLWVKNINEQPRKGRNCLREVRCGHRALQLTGLVGGGLIYSRSLYPKKTCFNFGRATEQRPSCFESFKARGSLFCGSPISPLLSVQIISFYSSQLCFLSQFKFCAGSPFDLEPQTHSYGSANAPLQWVCETVFEIALAINPTPSWEYKKTKSQSGGQVCQWGEERHRKRNIATRERKRPDPILKTQIVMAI